MKLEIRNEAELTIADAETGKAVAYVEREYEHVASQLATGPDLLDAAIAFVAFFRELEGTQCFEECLEGSPQLRGILAAINKATDGK
jgi:hypothetical protein